MFTFTFMVYVLFNIDMVVWKLSPSLSFINARYTFVVFSRMEQPR